MSVEIVNCDLFGSPATALCHQVNCHGIWSAGLAKEMKRRFPRAWQIDNMTLLHSRKKLGSFNFSAPNEDQDKWIFNIAGQYNYGVNKQQTDYDALYSAFNALKEFLVKMNLEDLVIGIPFGLGSGLGGGDFTKVLSIINYIFDDKDCKIRVIICKKD